MGQAAGPLMLALVAVVVLASGVPVFLAMFGVAGAFAVFGIAMGAFPAALLTALPSRVTGLLESDLLQALPLFVLMGGLLNRLPLAGIMFRALTRLTGRPVVAGLALGALMAPMNGSVGASVAMLSRVVRPRLDAAGIPPARGLAAICAAGTLGVVIPPSLVLILFGDAAMRAHTEALNLAGGNARVINTGDVFKAALVPAALIFALYLLAGWWGGQRVKDRPAVTPREWLAAAATTASVGILLGAVVLGYLYAVEAAACGAVGLTLLGLASGALRGGVLRSLLSETMAITGALFALFLAATTFTLVLRGFGGDRLLADMVRHAPGGAGGATVLVLLVIGVCALVLDAFEIILVVVPLLLPPLLTLVPDATWVSVLVLLALQISFILPPFGYAVLMARGMDHGHTPLRPLIRAVLPFLGLQVLVLGLVAAVPGMTHLLAGADTVLKPTVSDAEARRKLMTLPLPDDEPSAIPPTVPPR